jgi:hypothetical protein
VAIYTNIPVQTEFLEDLFQRFPDVPREVVLKVELLSLGHWFTDAALEATVGSQVKSYRLFSYDLVPMSQMERNESRKVPEYFVIFQGSYGLRPVIVQTTLDPNSPYVVDVVDGRLVLTANGQVLCNVAYPKAPGYYAKRTEQGVPYHEIIAYGFFTTVFRNCQYWGPKEECRFCDINENARQMKESHEFTLVAPVKPLEDVREVGLEVSREALATYGFQAPVTFLITGGTILKTLHGKDENEFYADYVRALKWAGPRRSVELQTNAKTKDEIKWLHGEGMDKHDANMEVWDQRLFEWINPGKTRRIGHDEWVRRMYDSVDVLGEGNVRPNFVGGIEMARPYGFESVDEAVASTTAGIDEMMAHGVLPRFNQWRREPKSNLVKEQSQPPIPTEFYLKLMRNRYDLWKKYGLPMPNYPNLVPEKTYMGVDHGTYDDYPLLMEASYYQNLEQPERTPEELIKRGLGGQDHPLNSFIHGPAK